MTEIKDKAIVKLSRPFEFNGKETVQLTMREPMVIDMLKYEKDKGGDLERESRYIANLCAFDDPSEIHRLPVYDYQQLADQLDKFLKGEHLK